MVDKLKMCVKQGEELSRSFTIKANNSPMDLTNLHVRFQVKHQPIARAKAIIDKDITVDSDINTIGQITSPTTGKFQVKFLEKDTSLPIGEYYLIISLQQEGYNDIISSNCCHNAKFYICEQ